ncbi:MAG TPA: GntR family transcriptional regulator [Candidatus Limnocylindria bacterium]|nr:GntR family transcriptional regulator [Candidatus Limnocylindria bacterium]
MKTPAELLREATVPIEAPPNLRERIYSQTKALIVTGSLAAGRLVSVAQLATMFNVSRTPVREALLELARDGILKPERNRGFRVVGHTPRELDEIFDVRVLLETEALAKAAANAANAAGAIEKARRLHVRVERALRAANLVDFQQLDREFHLTLVAIAGNGLLTKLISNLRDHLRLPYLSTLDQQGQLRPSLRDHLKLVDAVAAGDSEQAAELVRIHLARARIAVDQATSTRADDRPPKRDSRAASTRSRSR